MPPTPREIALSTLHEMVVAGRYDDAIAHARGARAMPAGNARRVIAYCEAMRDGRLEHPVEIAGIRFTMRISPWNVGHDIFVASGELQEMREMELLLSQPIAPRGTIVDIGANSGGYTVFLAKAFPHCTIVPIECLPAMCEEIRHNVAANRLTNVDLGRLGTAVGRHPGRARLVADPRYGAAGTRVVEDAAGETPVVRLSDLELGPVAFAKIDVEGQEIAVLEGMAGLLARQRFPMLVEVSRENYLAFIGFLCARQFRVNAVIKGSPGGTYVNLLVDRI